MSLAYNFVEQLSPERDGWKIKVRVTRMWDAINCNNRDLFSLDMILLDEHDDHIHASVHKNQAGKYRRQMHEGRIYLIQNFRVCPGKRQYRPVHRDYMISFTYVTFVKCVNGEDDKFNKHKCDFILYQDAPSFRGELTYTYDVIGFLIKHAKGKVYIVIRQLHHATTADVIVHHQEQFFGASSATRTTAGIAIRRSTFLASMCLHQGVTRGHSPTGVAAAFTFFLQFQHRSDDPPAATITSLLVSSRRLLVSSHFCRRFRQNANETAASGQPLFHRQTAHSQSSLD
ncbi:hypothetical protein Salat_1104700 [Sesamum alatum]|uniref:Replication protein A 70 kDa DNA-binding subunit B/D first OB fold domain-containing protein n=1 Tax=Sesamum alatum TaxID=300844 RepID=A0AAE1YN12_9LAMI|nr:hypothetical protein Salat_1104700 [Sesamum alatum]